MIRQNPRIFAVLFAELLILTALFAFPATALAAAGTIPPTLTRPAAPSCACSCPGCDCGCCVVANHNATRALIDQEHFITRRHMTQEMTYHQRWWFTDFFNEHVLPAQMMMSEQLTTVGMQQMEIVGAILDAKHQLESQRLFQTKVAEAHKDYHSSHGMCTIATAARGLSNADRRTEATSFILSQRSMARQLGEGHVASSDGPVQDHSARLIQFIRRYCDQNDANDTLREMCTSSSPQSTINKDIDYNRLIETPMTLQVEFTEGAVPQGDEEDVLSLASNLFSNTMFQRFSEQNLNLYANAQLYYDLRSVVAKRGVAENSFYAIVGMKAQGSEEAEIAAGYIGMVMRQLGVPEDEVFPLLGSRPSYFALMDVLSQKLYQRPEFYTDLYDKPANVARKDASMRAIELMVDRDMYKSDLRYEAMLSVLLELELMKHQRAVQNRLIDMSEVQKPE